MPGKSIIESAEEIIKTLENTEITALTKEQTAIFIQRQINFAKALIQLEKSKNHFFQKFLEYQQHVFKLDVDIAIAEDFIFSKGYRKEYQSFKSEKLNQQKTKLSN